jgi:hypothetical protein
LKQPIANSDQIIEVIATKNDKHYIQYMTISEWDSFNKQKRKAGYNYKAFQKGYSQFKLETIIDHELRN